MFLPAEILGDMLGRQQQALLVIPASTLLSTFLSLRSVSSGLVEPGEISSTLPSA